MKQLYTLILTAVLALTASSCINDEMQPCPFHLRLKYDYNMDYVDKFTRQARTLRLFIFDDNDLFVEQIERRGAELKSNEIDLILHTQEYGREYTFLAWVGIDYEHIVATEPVVGQTTFHEIEVALNYEARSQWAFEPLMVGLLSTRLEPEKVAEISLTKNTNKFRVAFRLASINPSKPTFRAEDYNIYIESNNTRYNPRNQIISDDFIHYYPYYKEDDERGFVVEISTLRIVEDRHNDLVITNAKTHEELLRIDLNQYLEDLRFLAHDDMPRQEFFDREDEFSIIIFLGNTGLFDSFDIEINGWLIREQDNDEEL